MGEDNDSTLGCLGGVIVVLVLLVLFWPWECFLADNFDYVTESCALRHLQKSNCNIFEDIFGVDEVTDISQNDTTGKRQETRAVIYRFRERPIGRPVSNQVLRGKVFMYKTKDGWLADCEEVPKKGE